MGSSASDLNPFKVELGKPSITVENNVVIVLSVIVLSVFVCDFESVIVVVKYWFGLEMVRCAVIT